MASLMEAVGGLGSEAQRDAKTRRRELEWMLLVSFEYDRHSVSSITCSCATQGL